MVGETKLWQRPLIQDLGRAELGASRDVQSRWRFFPPDVHANKPSRQRICAETGAGVVRSALTALEPPGDAAVLYFITIIVRHLPGTCPE